MLTECGGFRTKESSAVLGRKREEKVTKQFIFGAMPLENSRVHRRGSL